MAPRAGRRDAEPIEGLVASLSAEQLLEIVAAAVDRHEDVERSVRLVAARAGGDLTQLRAEVDRGLRTRRFLDYHASLDWAHATRPILTELDAAADDSPSADLVELLQRAVGHVVKVIQHADDSSGLIGDLARDLLTIHAKTCDAGVADPVKLATWMIRFRSRDQDFFEVDPVRYATALGDRGIAAYRKAVADAGDEDAFAVRYARERLAILDGDVDAIVEILGGDLTSAHQFRRVAEAMAELGRDDLVLSWASRGIAETGGWQLGALYDLACKTYGRSDQPLEVLRLRREQHERMPSSSTYGALKAAAQALEAWDVERDAARAILRSTDLRGYIQVLLADGDNQLAWEIATAAPADAIHAELWLKLAESRETDDPADALAVYQRIVDEVLVTTDRRAYASAVRILKRAKSAAHTAGKLEAFANNIALLRDQHRRRPTLIAMLDKAKLTDN